MRFTVSKMSFGAERFHAQTTRTYLIRYFTKSCTRRASATTIDDDETMINFCPSVSALPSRPSSLLPPPQPPRTQATRSKSQSNWRKVLLWRVWASSTRRGELIMYGMCSTHTLRVNIGCAGREDCFFVENIQIICISSTPILVFE